MLFDIVIPWGFDETIILQKEVTLVEEWLLDIVNTICKPFVKRTYPIKPILCCLKYKRVHHVFYFYIKYGKIDIRHYKEYSDI